MLVLEAFPKAKVPAAAPLLQPAILENFGISIQFLEEHNQDLETTFGSNYKAHHRARLGGTFSNLNKEAVYLSWLSVSLLYL